MNCWPSGKYVNLLYIYLILGIFALITASIRHGGDQFVALLRWYGSQGFFDSVSAIFWSLVSHFLLDNTPKILYGVQLAEFAGQSSTPTPWSFNQLLAVWAGAKSCWKMKSASLKSWSAEGSIKCSKMSW